MPRYFIALTLWWPLWSGLVSEVNTQNVSANDPEGDLRTASGRPVNPIVVKGEFLYDSVTQKRFFAKGIDYNPRPATYQGPANTPQCQAGHSPYDSSWSQWGKDLIDDDKEALWGDDLDAIAELGANTVRVYGVDPAKSHDKFMQKAARLGLYVIIPLTRADWGWLPAGYPSPTCYTANVPDYGNVGTNLLTSAKLIVKQFSKYDNTLLFTVGNEVETNDPNGIAALPCVKALTRDIHKFQSDCQLGMRRVPLLYSATDIGGQNRLTIAKYVTCELETNDGVADAVDVYGLNIYSWCDTQYFNTHGQPDFTFSPYFEIERDLGFLTKPFLFTEFGCKLSEFKTSCPYKGGRKWVELEPIMGRLAQLLSGAMAYCYSMEGAWQDQPYGIVLKPGYLKGQNSLVKLDEYYALQKMYQTHDISTRWDAAWTDKTRCSWDPAVGPFAPGAAKLPGPSLSTARSAARCPSAQEVNTLFQQQGHSRSTWFQPLAPTPPDATVECPRYDVSVAMLKESMCYGGMHKSDAVPVFP